MTVLCIAGHGKARSGRIDPGATGIITKGEHKYMVENLFPLMKKHVGKEDVVKFLGEQLSDSNQKIKDTLNTEFTDIHQYIKEILKLKV